MFSLILSFLKYTVNIPYLHSSPTRRSSDLMFRLPEVPRVIVNLGGIANITWLPGSSEQVLGFDTGPANTLLEDRKSTRLNSSHVRISYAVFCLKKKIYNHNIFLTEYTYILL